MPRQNARKRPRPDAATTEHNSAEAAKRQRADRVQSYHLVSLTDGTLVLINLTRTVGVHQSALLSFLTARSRDVTLSILQFLSPDQLLDMRSTCRTLLPVANRAVARLAQQLLTPACGLRDYIYYRHVWLRAYNQTEGYTDYDRPRLNKSDAMRTYLLSRAEVDALPARQQWRPVAATVIAVEDVLRAVAVKYGSVMAWQRGEAKREARRLRGQQTRDRRRKWRDQHPKREPSSFQLAGRAAVQACLSGVYHCMRAIARIAA